MTNKPKRIGTAAETAFVGLLRDTYWPHAERRALAGGKDLGDTTGHPGLVFEVKAAKMLCIPKWLRETEAERVNAKADYGILIVKPQGVGATRVGLWWAVTDVDTQNGLIARADFPSVYTYDTSIRRSTIPDALFRSAVVRSEWHAYHCARFAPHGDVPGYTVMEARNMLALLFRAGYGPAA